MYSLRCVFLTNAIMVGKLWYDKQIIMLNYGMASKLLLQTMVWQSNYYFKLWYGNQIIIVLHSMKLLLFCIVWHGVAECAVSCCCSVRHVVLLLSVACRGMVRHIMRTPHPLRTHSAPTLQPPEGFRTILTKLMQQN